MRTRAKHYAKFLVEDGESDTEQESSDIRVSENNIYLYGEINLDISLDFNYKFTKLEKEMLIHGVKFNIDAPPILVHINSIGGDIIPALSMVDTIRNSKVSVHTIIEGECMSAATLISCVGQKRLMRRNSVVLIHQMRTSYWGKLDECKEDMKNNKKLTTILKDIYITNTNMEMNYLEKMLKKDIYITSEKCLSLGIVDEIM